MNIEELLTEKKKTIIQKWIDQVLDSYSSPGFFKKQKDRFANPIGATVSDGLQEIYTILLEGRELAEAARHLEYIIKIRAVQDFNPSQAVAFVYQLKNIVRDEVAKVKDQDQLLDGLAKLDTRIDQVALMAFDFYMNCRERLHQIRVNEILSGRSALTDGNQCVSAMLKRSQTESTDNSKINRLT